MEPATRDPDTKPNGFLLPNGAVKKLQRPPPQQTAETAAADEVLYRECLKNHAANLGGHALDGCGEFMPSPAANSADPTSLKCAACGCHRNFHRRIYAPRCAAGSDDGLEGEGERDARDDGVEEGGTAAFRRRSCSSPPQPYFSSAPHMLLALRDGAPAAYPMAAVPPPRKRFRTKFSPEQKEKMLELSGRLGWRLQKRDERMVEEYCRRIGVGRDVFKVWMHNNKHHLFGSSGPRRGEAGNSAMDSPAAAGGANGPEVEANGSGDSGDADGIDSGHVMNGGTSVLYSSICRHAKVRLMSNKRVVDEEVSTYRLEHPPATNNRSLMNIWFEKHKKLHTTLLVVVMLGTCMVIGDGILTQCISCICSL